MATAPAPTKRYLEASTSACERLGRLQQSPACLRTHNRPAGQAHDCRTQICTDCCL